MSVAPMLYDRGHQVSSRAAKTSNARSGVALTVISRRTAVSVTCMVPPLVSTASLKAARAWFQNESK